MSKLKPCPFCGSEVFLLDVATRSDANAKWDVYCRTHECFLNSGTNNMFSNREDAMIAWNTRAESRELATLREQVKVLREALGWLDNEMDCRDADFGGCLFTRQDFEIVRNVLKQTKPKEVE